MVSSTFHPFLASEHSSLATHPAINQLTARSSIKTASAFLPDLALELKTQSLDVGSLHLRRGSLAFLSSGWCSTCEEG